MDIKIGKNKIIIIKFRDFYFIFLLINNNNNNRKSAPNNAFMLPNGLQVGYLKEYNNLQMYVIFGSGHMVMKKNNYYYYLYLFISIFLFVFFFF